MVVKLLKHIPILMDLKYGAVKVSNKIWRGRVNKLGFLIQ